MKFIIVLLVFVICQQKQLKLSYNNSIKAIELFNSKGKKINFKITFENKDVLMHQSLKNQQFFIQNSIKHKLVFDQHVKYEYKVRPGSIQDDSMGSIGFQQGSVFFQILKRSLNLHEIKFEFRPKQGVINIINQACKYPLFTPLQITLSQSSTHTYTINSFSVNFFPDQSILRLLGKTKNPFQVNSATINEEITISVRDRIISVPFKELFTCGKYLNSDSYECQVNIKPNADIGGLLLFFNPIICSSGIELHRSIDESWGFHYSHIGLLILQLIVLAMLVEEQKVIKILKKCTFRSKNH